MSLSSLFIESTKSVAKGSLLPLAKPFSYIHDRQLARAHQADPELVGGHI